jgi:chemotaxis protein MotB
VEEEHDCVCPPGIPAWVMTFADLMSLLMCFFVLLLSFSELDVLKFKRLAGSMKQAFGVQLKLDVTEVPKGTSIIAQEFSPGKPEPTPLNEIWQKTSDMTENSLEVFCQDLGSSNVGEKGDAQRQIIIDEVADLVGETEQDALAFEEGLRVPVDEGQIEIETEGRKILIRIKEQGTFQPGSAEIDPSFVPTLDLIRELLRDIPGQIDVEGHSDASGSRSADNWGLSASRAVTVTTRLIDYDELDPERFTVVGHGDTRPVGNNATREGRARNRRVEIIVRQGLDQDVQSQLRQLRETDPRSFESVSRELDERFRIRPEEIF